MTRLAAGKGFTLAELLIALAILGVIATFAIPKVLQAQQNSQYNAMAKEAAAMLSAAYSKHRLSGLADENTSLSDLTTYMNYVSVDTSSLIDSRPGATGTSRPCAGQTCLRLHNGSIIWFPASVDFGGTSSLDAAWVYFDPDGKYTGKQDSVSLYVYYSGKITTRANVAPGTTDGSGSTYNPDPTLDPDWFSWD